jgi:PKHD-type hydroxylase
MNVHVFRLLDREETEQVLAALANARFADGRATAHGTAKGVKNNLQTEFEDESLAIPDRILQNALQRNEAFNAFAQPKAIRIPMYSRYEPGMHYGDHVDSAMMGGAAKIRTDLSMTLFLSPPESYDGGELVIRGGAGESYFKLDAGEAVVYPSTSIHQAAPVTKGVRMAAVTWIQSMVRDGGLREIVWDVWRLQQRTAAIEDMELALLMSKTYNNLIRYAAEP